MKRFLFISLMMLSCIYALSSTKATTASSHDITLYYKPQCPYCVKVLNYFHSIHKEPPLLKNTSEKHYQDELVKVGGKKQVPCLVYKQKALYESDKIIEWIKTHQDLFANSP